MLVREDSGELVWTTQCSSSMVYFILSCYSTLRTLIHIFYSCDYICYPALGYYYCSLLLMTVFLRLSVFVKGNFSSYECVAGRLRVHPGTGRLKTRRLDL